MFNQPSGLTVDAAGTIYVADAGNAFLRKVTAGGAVTTLALTAGTSAGGAGGSGGSLGSGSSSSSSAPTSFQFVTSVARDSAGNLYAADSSTNIIVKVTSAGGATILAGSTGVAGMQDGTGTNALFSRPGGVAVDSGGNVYVADAGNAVIRKVSSSGVVTTLAGSPSSRGNRDGAGSSAQFNNPSGVAVDAAGNVYVADTYNNSIRKVTSSGTVTTLAGSTIRGDADGTGSAAQFDNPTGVTVDTSGNVYVADAYNATIRKITSAGTVTTLAGSAGIIGANNGTGINALFNLPIGVTVDNSGNVYVADAGNALIRKIAPGGTVTTVAGVAGVAGWGDGTGIHVLFNQPRGLATDGAGTIYVADTGNGRIRKIASDGMVVTPSIQATTTSAGGDSGGTSGQGSSGGSGASGGSGSASTGGGGGGAMEAWFVLTLALLGIARCRYRRL
jgi:sugar lactone lactonase YvrE